MGLLGRLVAYAKVLRRGKRHRNDFTSHLIRRPALLLATGATEVAHLLSGRVDARLKALAQAKVAALVGCPF